MEGDRFRSVTRPDGVREFQELLVIRIRVIQEIVEVLDRLLDGLDLYLVPAAHALRCPHVNSNRARPITHSARHAA
jgi:hypothetical protein